MDAFPSKERPTRARRVRPLSLHASLFLPRTGFHLVSLSSALFLIILAGSALLFWPGSQARAAQADDLTAIKFNEILSSSKKDWDGDGQTGDQWIELANHSSSTVSLAGLQVLSQNSNNNQPLLLPLSYSIGANGFLAISIKNIPQIRLFSGGGQLQLLDENGQIIDSVGYPALDADSSYARTSGGQWAITTTPTPGAANTFTSGTTPQPTPTPTKNTGGGGGGGGGNGSSTATPTQSGTVVLPTNTPVVVPQTQGDVSSPGGTSDQFVPSWVKITLIALIGATLLVVVIWYIRSWRQQPEGDR